MCNTYCVHEVNKIRTCPLKNVRKSKLMSAFSSLTDHEKTAILH